jgi:uncharacterized protein VirK/YbjX
MPFLREVIFWLGFLQGGGSIRPIWTFQYQIPSKPYGSFWHKAFEQKQNTSALCVHYMHVVEKKEHKRVNGSLKTLAALNHIFHEIHAIKHEYIIHNFPL